MGIKISLERLVAKANTEDLWPDEFRQLIMTLTGQVGDKTLWGAVADWLEEHDEYGLERAFRWVYDRPAVEVEMLPYFMSGRPRPAPVWWFRMESRAPISIYKLMMMLLDDEPTDRQSEFLTIPTLMAWWSSALRKLDTVTQRPPEAIHVRTDDTDTSEV